MFNLPWHRGVGRDVLKLRQMPAGILKSVRTKGSGSASDRSGVLVLFPSSGTRLLPAKHARELDEEIQAFQTPYAVTGEMSSPFKLYKLLFGGVWLLLP